MNETQNTTTDIPSPVTDVPTEKKVINVTEIEKKPINKKSIIKKIIPVVVLALILGWAAYVYKSDQALHVTKVTVEQKVSPTTPDLGKVPDLGVDAAKPVIQQSVTPPIKVESPVQSLPEKAKTDVVTAPIVVTPKPHKKIVKKSVQPSQVPVKVEQKVEVKTEQPVKETPVQSDVPSKDSGK